MTHVSPLLSHETQAKWFEKSLVGWEGEDSNRGSTLLMEVLQWGLDLEHREWGGHENYQDDCGDCGALYQYHGIVYPETRL